MTTAPLHPSLTPVAFLLGQWSGAGAGSYPTIDDFTYGEHLTFGHVGKLFLTYAQRTWDPATGAGMHVETGYLRVSDPSGPGDPIGVEMVIAQPTGVTEILAGTLTGTSIVVRSSTVGLTASAKEVTAVERELRVEDGALVTRLAMAAVGQPLTHHLASRLSPVSG
jgi:hypothetical protein